MKRLRTILISMVFLAAGTTPSFGIDAYKLKLGSEVAPAKTQARAIPPFGELVLVPSGRFLMGSTSEEVEETFKICVAKYPECDRAIFESEYPDHVLWLDAYYIDRFKITNRQYRECILEDECTPPRKSDIIRDPKFDNYPVVFVDWFQAENYCNWAGGRLPTEAEWEKAARGIEAFIYPWGDEMKEGFAVWDAKSPAEITAKPNAASAYGVYDMAGNVWEWVGDWFDPAYYSMTPYYNPEGPPKGLHKVFRGGSWGSNLAVFLRSATRNHNRPIAWNAYTGIRCAKDVEEK